MTCHAHLSMYWPVFLIIAFIEAPVLRCCWLRKPFMSSRCRLELVFPQSLKPAPSGSVVEHSCEIIVGHPNVRIFGVLFNATHGESKKCSGYSELGWTKMLPFAPVIIQYCNPLPGLNPRSFIPSRPFNARLYIPQWRLPRFRDWRAKNEGLLSVRLFDLLIVMVQPRKIFLR
jgi:hypothetical protein